MHTNQQCGYSYAAVPLFGRHAAVTSHIFLVFFFSILWFRSVPSRPHSAATAEHSPSSTKEDHPLGATTIPHSCLCRRRYPMAAVGCFPPAGRGRGQSGNAPWKWTWKWSRPDMLRQDCHAAAAAPSTSSIHTMPCHAMRGHARQITSTQTQQALTLSL